MRLNGLYVVARLAARDLDHPLVHRYERALVLGSLREDVWWIPGLRVVFEHFSFSHFYRPGLPGGLVPFLWPGPRLKADRFFRLAVREARAGRTASGFVQLGRVVHLLADMACPVHAHRSPHETDPFEWWVEGNKARLLELPVPHVPDARRASDLIESLARATQSHASDDTNTWIGRILKRLGLLESVSAQLAGEQARALVPVACGHAAALLRLFLREIGAGARAPDGSWTSAPTAGILIAGLERSGSPCR